MSFLFPASRAVVSSAKRRCSDLAAVTLASRDDVRGRHAWTGASAGRPTATDWAGPPECGPCESRRDRSRGRPVRAKRPSPGGGPTRRVLQLLGDVEDTFGVVFMAGPLDPTRLISNVPREPALISLKWEPEARTPGPRDTGLLVGITELDHVIGVGGRLRPQIHGRIEAGQRWRSAMVQLPQVPDAIDVRMEQPEDRIL
jgi:hypothetical protein